MDGVTMGKFCRLESEWVFNRRRAARVVLAWPRIGRAKPGHPECLHFQVKMAYSQHKIYEVCYVIYSNLRLCGQAGSVKAPCSSPSFRRAGPRPPASRPG